MAKGPYAKVVISGRGLQDSIVVTDHTILDELQFAALMDFERPAPAPSTTEHYALIYYYADGHGNSRPGFVMRYYPDPSGGIGIFHNAYAPKGPWLHATSEGDSLLKRLLRTHKIGEASSLYIALLAMLAAVLSLLKVRQRFLRIRNVEH